MEGQLPKSASLELASSVIGMDFDAGWLLPTATLATGTSTFVSGK